jgi:hypothetical protein
MRKSLASVPTLIFVAVSVATLTADSVFDFENAALGTSTDFTAASADGLYNATFSAGVTASFVVDVNPYGIGSGQRLTQVDATAIQNPQIIPLTISIANGQFTKVTFPFALLAPVEDDATLTLQAFLNGTPLALTGTATSNVPQDIDHYSTGLLTFDPGPGNAFNSFTLTPSVPGLSIDDVSITPSVPVAGMPEPATAALLIFGVAGILGCIRARERRRASSRN